MGGRTNLAVPAVDGSEYVITEVNEQLGLAADSWYHMAKQRSAAQAAGERVG